MYSRRKACPGSAPGQAGLPSYRRFSTSAIKTSDSELMVTV